MNNLARVAMLALGAYAAKKYMNTRTSSTIVTDTSMAPPSAGSPDLVDATGTPIDASSPQARAQASLRSMAANPNVAWIADPQLRQRNLQRLKDVWAQRHLP